MAEQVKSSTINLETKDIPMVYSNQISMALSATDVRIVFAEILPQTLEIQLGPNPVGQAKQADPLVRPLAGIIMTPEFAKRVAKSIATLVDTYEKTFGQIRTEPSAEAIQKALNAKPSR